MALRWLFGFLVVAILGWAGLQLLKIDRMDFNLSAQGEKLGKIDGQVKTMRLVFRDFLLDDKPDRKALIKRLVALQPIPLYIGMQDYVEGKYDSAFGRWIPAAQQGDQESKAVAESALFKLYQGNSMGYEPVKHQMAAGALSEIIKSNKYDPSDPNVAKFKSYLNDLPQRQPPPATPYLK